MRVCIHESRQDHASHCIDDLRIAWRLLFDDVRRARDNDYTITYQHSAVWYNGKITQLGANSWPLRPRKRNELRGVENRERLHPSLLSTICRVVLN
jgi:hypothetical protein